ncbi:MAG: ATP-dependent helicase HelY, partial [Frankiaceae bacterium]|nr:ATP-dependent helicase HelY [Frankiaceae bacterium]
MASPAQRYAASRRRAGHRALAEFATQFEFSLDPFQLAACEALEDGHGVLVAAPTGAGKTVVGEFAVHLALRSGAKCFYTTPIKALSNQKYGDLVARHGADNVGLLTGDNAVNGDAAVVVMTTEVLRNMLYAGSPALRGLAYVVMDEVHYLADRFRGAVWEEVILHLPDTVTLVSLSATVSNAEEFGDWLQTVRGDTTVIVEEHRPVPLWQSVLVGRRLYDLFVDDDQQDVNGELLRLASDEARFNRVYDDRRPQRGGRRPRSRIDVPSRPEVVETLDRAGLLPVIVFIFSRAGCDAAVLQCLRRGLRLTEPAERDVVRRVAAERTAEIPDDDLRVLGYGEFLDGLERGVAAHHAGMLPVFKEIVETLFAQGLVKVVFATETLALGINMPARSVVVEKLSKFTGERHEFLTPGEYTQITGRAGRRGIDEIGYAIALWSPYVPFDQVASLASKRTYALRSSFRPTYNMAANLVRRYTPDVAHHLLNLSFAQYGADRDVVRLEAQLERSQQMMDAARRESTCDRGDVSEYRRLLRDVEDAAPAPASVRSQVMEALERVKPGDILLLPGGKSAGRVVVLSTARRSGGEVRLGALT